MNPTHIEHIGIAVTSLEESIPFFETLLGTKCYNIEEVVDQKVKTAFFKPKDISAYYTEEEIKNSNIVDTVIKVIDKECNCPNIQNDSCINTEIKDEITNDTSQKENDNLININTASLNELQELSGIGESKANNIIKYREENGEFKNLEDIKHVLGIGDSVYSKIKDYIKL